MDGETNGSQEASQGAQNTSQQQGQEQQETQQGQPQIGAPDYEKQIAERDEKIASLEAQVAEAAKNVETAEQLRGEIAGFTGMAQMWAKVRRWLSWPGGGNLVLPARPRDRVP